MMEVRHHATTQNQFYPDMSNVNKNITVEVKLISPPTYLESWDYKLKKKHVQATTNNMSNYSI